MIRTKAIVTLAGALVVILATGALGRSPSASVNATSADASTPHPEPAITFVVARDGNEARYRVREQLAGFDLPNDAVGVSRDVTGSIAFDESGTVIAAQSRIVVGVASLQSDKARRDGFIRSRVLETDRYPDVELVVTGIRGASLPIPSSGSRSFSLDGILTIRGVSRPTTWNVDATFSGNTITGKAATQFTFAGFDLSQPRVPIVLSVADTIRLEYDFTVQRQ